MTDKPPKIDITSDGDPENPANIPPPHIREFKRPNKILPPPEEFIRVPTPTWKTNRASYAREAIKRINNRLEHVTSEQQKTELVRSRYQWEQVIEAEESKK